MEFYAQLSDEARELCLNRMARTLAKRPRKKVSREYLQTLSKSKETPEQFLAKAKQAVSAVKRKEFDRARQIARNYLTRLQDETNARLALPPKVRKDRLRPRAKPLPNANMNCRSADRQRYVEPIPSRRERLPRDMNEVLEQRAALFAAQDGACPYCGGPIAERKNVNKCSLDHVIPRSEGGKDGLGNYLLVHSACNGAKANDFPTGCELVWLLAVNAKVGALPVTW